MTLRLLLGLVLATVAGSMARAVDPIDIGSRRELLIDDYLVERLDGGARLRLHHPRPREVAIVHDAPWEGSGSGYHSVFRDGPLYRMYYKAWDLDVSGGRLRQPHPLYCCYAESDDGVCWRKPELGLHEVDGSKVNNVVMVATKIGQLTLDPGHPSVFKDENPDCPPDARYKALVGAAGHKGLLALKSPDGIHWSPIRDTPVITAGAFDSQNLAFWDPVRREYRAYWRIFTAGVTNDKTWKPAGYRDIRTATSKDFVQWGPHTDLKYGDAPKEHLYTNQIKPYHRAPHIFIGFPTRYIDRGWSDSMRELPEHEHRQQRAKANQRYGTALTEGLLMSSRDGVNFHRWSEAFLRPGAERAGSWHYGQQYIAWHVVETASAVEGAPKELSLYATESYWTGGRSVLRRYTLRLDGFASVEAPAAGGQFTTRPLTFQGKRLVMNFATSAAGSVQVEIQDAAGKPIEGFALADCPETFGDSIERTVTWSGGADVGRLAGKPVRLRFVLRDADLYAFQFAE